MAGMSGKRDFLDDVVDDMGDDKGGTKYGADMTEEGEGTDEEEQQDKIMAAKQLCKALGISTADFAKVADAMEAFINACNGGGGDTGGVMEPSSD